MTDELLYAKLARAIAESGSPVPSLHDQHVGFLGMVYPILLAPLYGLLDPVTAFDAAHVLNAVLFAGAAVPAYLLARRLLPPVWSLAVALLTVAVPWSVISAMVMSEAAAYPVFLWAVLAFHCALAEPSPRRDALALAALGLAYFTRPQFLFLAAVLPLAAIAVDGGRRAFAHHRLLAQVYAGGIVAVAIFAALGKGHRLLGDYGVTATQGSLLPAGVWKSAAIHLDTVAIGIGILPLLLGAGWAYANLRAAPRPRAFAAITALSVPLLALEAASYDLRFGGAGVIRDRYVFYLAPLLLLASAVSLHAPRLPVLGIALATAFFAGTVAFAELKPLPGLSVDSPVEVVFGLIHDESAGLPAGVFVCVCGLLIGVIGIGLAWLPRPLGAAVSAVVVLGFSAAVAGTAFDKLLTSRAVSGLPVRGDSRVRDWVDRATNGSVGLLAYPISRTWDQSAVAWWEAEFWNDSATRAFVVPDGHFTYTPFPSATLRLDAGNGLFDRTEHAPPYILVSETESRFGLAGSQLAATGGLVLLTVERPYRALWATDGLDPDGWTRPSHAAKIRVFAEPGRAPQLVRVAVSLDAPPEARTAAAYRLDTASGTIAPGSRVAAEASVCVPRGGHADLTLGAPRSATIAGPPFGPERGQLREVGVVVSGVRLTPTGEAC